MQAQTETVVDTSCRRNEKTQFLRFFFYLPLFNTVSIIINYYCYYHHCYYQYYYYYYYYHWSYFDFKYRLLKNIFPHIGFYCHLCIWFNLLYADTREELESGFLESPTFQLDLTNNVRFRNFVLLRDRSFL